MVLEKKTTEAQGASATPSIRGRRRARHRKAVDGTQPAPCEVPWRGPVAHADASAGAGGGEGRSNGAIRLTPRRGQPVRAAHPHGRDTDRGGAGDE